MSCRRRLLPVCRIRPAFWEVRSPARSKILAGRSPKYTNWREREMFYLTTHSTHFIYGYMASDIWLRTILIVRKETRCRHIGYSYRLTARVLLYAPSHRQDSTYHSLCYTSRGALAGTNKQTETKVCFVTMLEIIRFGRKEGRKCFI